MEAAVSDLAEVDRLLSDLAHVKSINRLKYYKPYPYQIAFHNAKATRRRKRPPQQRLLMAGTRSARPTRRDGSGLHATGLYPDWWKGTRFLSPPEILVCGLTNDSVRDIGQRELLGDPTDDKALGTGTIPKLKIGKRRTKTGVPNAYDSVRVQHVSGGWSRIYFRAYEQGWKKFQGIAFEAAGPMRSRRSRFGRSLSARPSRAGSAIILCTMTPEEGMTEVVTQFMESLQKGQALITATWDDAPHLTARSEAAAPCGPPAARARHALQGNPAPGRRPHLPGGHGRGDRHRPDRDPAALAADHRRGLRHLDEHPFSAANLAWDRDADTVYLTHEYQTTNDLPAAHIDAIKAWGAWKPVSWPHDGLNREKGSGDELQQSTATRD
jgi:hypothetical protein